MATPKRFKPQLDYQGPRFDSTEARSYQAVSKQLGALSDAALKVSTDLAVTDATQEGLQAGTGQVRGVTLKQEQTIRGKAYNQAAIAAHLAAVKTDIRSNVGRLEIEHGRDSKAFASALKGYSTGLLKELDPRVRPDARADIADYASRAGLRILEREQVQQIKVNAAEIATAAQGIQIDALNAYRAGEVFDDKGKPGLALTLQGKLFDTWDAGVATGVLDVNAVNKAKASFLQDADSNMLLGEFGRVLQKGGIEAAETALKKFKRIKKSDLPPEARDKLVTTMETWITRERTRENRAAKQQKAQQTALVKKIEVAVKDAETVLKSGALPAGVEQLRILTKGTQLEGRLARAMEIFERVEEFAPLHPLDQEDFLRKMGQPKTAAGLELKESLEKAHQTTVRLLKDDPIQLGVNLGIISAPEPIQMGDPASVQRRMEQVRAVEAHYGMDNLSPMTPVEISHWSRAMTNMGTDQKLVVLNSLVSAMGENASPVLDQLGQSSQPVMAVAGNLIMQGQGTTARLAIRGAEFLTELKGVTPTGMDDSIRAELKGVFNSNPQALSAMTSTIKAVYTSMVAESGVSDFKNLDKDRLEEAVRKVTGGILDIDSPGTGWLDDYTIQAPAFGVDADQFQDWIDDLTADDIDGMGGVFGLSGTAAEIPQDLGDENKNLLEYHRDSLYQRGGKKSLVNDDGSRTTVFVQGVSVGDRIYNVPGYDNETGEKIDEGDLVDHWKDEIKSGKFPSYPEKFSGPRKNHPSNVAARRLHKLIDADMGGYTGGLMQAIETIKSSTLIGVGQGRYLIDTGAGFLFNKAGKPFILTWPSARIDPELAMVDPETEMPSIAAPTGMAPPAEESGPMMLNFGGVETVMNVPENTGTPITEPTGFG